MNSKSFTLILCLFLILKLQSQAVNNFEISFENAVHHEARITAVFHDLDDKKLSVRMSRTSPGRYAIHEFAKNVYGLRAEDSKGKKLKVTRHDPYQWDIEGHDGTVKITYTLFANRADGTYSQIDETHAHLNMPATFIYAPDYADRPVQIKFHLREDLKWKIATQLKHLKGNLYYANDLDYFMDSPAEISDHEIKSYEIESKDKNYTIYFVLHQADKDEGFDLYFENVKKIIEEEVAVFGTLPAFDFGAYHFLACYIPNASGDGMEHRNSTILTSTRPLSQGGAENNIGTVAHEFFHAWNVERIRPKSLEPFDYADANLSGELWFAEGFTSYYTYLILCRAGIISKEQYAESLSGVLNYVWNSPARDYFNVVEMSYQATFVDAATSIDPVNRENTFISYYSYGNALGLALDLSLRNLDDPKRLDDFMRLVWETYGKDEIPYTLNDLETLLGTFAGSSFSESFFNSYIYQSNMPDYEALLSSVGIGFERSKADQAHLGAWITNHDNKWLVDSNPDKKGALYDAGIVKGDRIISIDGKLTNNKLKPETLLKSYQPGDTVKVVYNRFGEIRESMLTFVFDPAYQTFLQETPDPKAKKRQDKWLNERSR